MCRIERRLASTSGKKVDVHVWRHVELVVTGTECIPVENIAKEQLEKD